MNNCPCLLLSDVLNRVLGENITGVADGGFAIAKERARIGHVAIPRRLNDLNGRLVHVVFEMMTTVQVDMPEVIDQSRHTWKAWPHNWRRRWGSMWHLMLLHIAFKDCLEENGRAGPRFEGIRKKAQRELFFVKIEGKGERRDQFGGSLAVCMWKISFTTLGLEAAAS